MIALKPCPFCGSQPVIGPWKDAIDQSNTCPTAIECSAGLDACPVNPSVCQWSRSEAIAAWNTRHDDDPRYTITDAGRALIAGTD